MEKAKRQRWEGWGMGKVGKTQKAIKWQPKYIRCTAGCPVISWKEQDSHCVADLLTEDLERDFVSIASGALNGAGVKRLISDKSNRINNIASKWKPLWKFP